MAVLQKDNRDAVIEQRSVDAIKNAVNKFNAKGEEKALKKREMKITYEGICRVLVSSLEFIAFAFVAGVCCWGLAYGISQGLSVFIH